MKKSRIIIYVALLLIFTALVLPVSGEGAAEGEDSRVQIPESVMSIENENTYPNQSQDLPRVQPNPLAEELLSDSEVRIDNPELIKMLNESTVKSPKYAFGLNASVYLGEWPLSYDSETSDINWDYEKVNTNMVDNRGGSGKKNITYLQQEQKRVKGGLTSEVSEAETVKQLMHIEAAKRTGLPLGFSTVIGFGTETSRVYHVAPENLGYLHAYVPAVNEKGSVRSGEVYLIIKRGKASLEVKNVTEQEVGAWIPVKNYVNLKMETTTAPR